MAVNFQPVMTISKHDNTWCLISKSTLSPGISVNSIMNGTDGIEFDFGLLKYYNLSINSYHCIY